MPFKPSAQLNHPTGVEGPPLAWSELKFNPIGLYSLRRRLGFLSQEPGIFQHYQQSFLASDIAWFAAGASEDGQHLVTRDTFHPFFGIFRENSPTGIAGTTLRANLRQHIRQLIFDLATIWDRTYGGSTMVLHVDGTTVPGTPVLPEYLKADVYLPPHLIEEQPERHHAIKEIVQSYIENIGIPTVSRWAAAARNLGWSLTQTGRVPMPTPHYSHTIPRPSTSGSAHYIFHGRPYSSCQVPESAPTTAITPQPSQSSEIYYTDDSESTMLLFVANEKISELEVQLAQACQKEQDLLLEISNLQIELATTFSTLRAEEAKLAVHKNYGRTSSSSKLASPTPLRCASPFSPLSIPPSTPRKRFAASSPGKSSPFQNIDPSMFPRPFSGLSAGTAASPNLSLKSPLVHRSPDAPCVISNPNAGTGITKLGPATQQFIVANNLVHIVPLLILITQYEPAPRWGKMLSTLSLPHHDLLLDAMTDDWVAGAVSEESSGET